MKLMIAGNTLFDFSLLLRHLPFGRELKAGLAHLAAIRAKRLPRLIKFRITFWVTTHTHTPTKFSRAKFFFPLLAAITPSSALKLNASKFALKHTHTDKLESPSPMLVWWSNNSQFPFQFCFAVARSFFTLTITNLQSSTAFSSHLFCLLRSSSIPA